MASMSAEKKPRSQTTPHGHMTPSHDLLSTLLECMRSAWEGPEDAASCACRFLACVAGAEQEEQLRRVLSFVEAVRGGLVERLGGCEGGSEGEGDVEDASRKRARCEAGREAKEGQGEPEEARREAGAKDEARPGLSGQAGTAAAVAPEAACMAAQEGMSRAGKGVLLDGDLLGCVWGFVLGGSGRQDVCVLGQLSVVCRKWREVSLREAWWGRIAGDMLPLLWEEEEQTGQAGSSRGRVVQYGRFLKGQRELAHKTDWDDGFLERLEGHVEMFDRMDGLQMFSMRGPVSFADLDEYVSMRFFRNSPQVRIKSSTFSAASRDPVLRRFATMEEYLRRGYGKEYPCCLCIRVTLRDTRTGRMAVVWAQDNVSMDWFDDDENGFDCYAHGGRPREILIERLMYPSRACLRVRRVEDQGEGEQDRLYRIDSISDAISPPSLDVEFTGISDRDEGEDRLTLEHFRLALQAVMTPASRDSGVRAARS